MRGTSGLALFVALTLGCGRIDYDPTGRADGALDAGDPTRSDGSTGDGAVAVDGAAGMDAGPGSDAAALRDAAGGLDAADRSDAAVDPDGGDAGSSAALGHARSVSVGSRAAICAVLDDGALWCWGDTRWGSFPAPATAGFMLPTRIGAGTDWREVSVGAAHGCGIRAPGSLWCWGTNAFGEVGDGTTSPVLEPTQIGTSDTWSSVSCGFETSCALDAAGAVWCWGRNRYGELGDGTTAARSTPQRVAGLGVTQVLSHGSVHVCALSSAGEVRCWGNNSAQQLGDGTRVDSPVPVLVAGSFAQVHARVDNTVAVASDGTLWGWGNAFASGPQLVDTRTGWTEVRATLHGLCGILGEGSLWCRGTSDFAVAGTFGSTGLSLVQVGAGARFDTLSLTSQEGCANQDGVLACIGSGNRGQLADSSERFDRRPRQVPGTWSSVSAATYGTCAVDAASRALCWGVTAGFPADELQRPTSPGLPAVAAIAQGGAGGLAVTTTGALWRWGLYLNGSGGSDRALTPELMASGPWGTSIAARSYDFLAAVRADGSLETWGRNSGGRLGDGTTTDRAAPASIGAGYASVALGATHGCALRLDGTLRCWGSNWAGQLGDGTTTDRAVPTVSAPGAWLQIAAGESTTLAIRSDATLWAWGSNGVGRLGLGGVASAPTATQVGSATWRAVATWANTSCGVRADGSLWCWGSDAEGQVSGVPGPDVRVPMRVGTRTDWADVAVGAEHACARTTAGALFCWGDNRLGQRGDGLAWRSRYAPVLRP